MSSSSQYKRLKGRCYETVNSEVDFCARLRLFEAWDFIGPASFSSRSQACALCVMLLLLCSAPSSLSTVGGGWKEACATVHALLCFRNSCG